MEASTREPARPRLRRAVPNETWQLVMEFDSPHGFRIFDAMIAYEERGYDFLAYPQSFKNLTCDDRGVYWGTRGTLDADYLYDRSRPLSGQELRRQWLRVGYMNQAPTSAHPTHHVYEVGIRPFDDGEPFSLTESIHGGHFEMGGSRDLSLEGLISDPDWKRNFELSGCGWAVGVVERGYPHPEVTIEALVREVCRRAGGGDVVQKRRTPG